ncbi:MAG: hypothetical protein KDA37_16270, partial [Planctomycetales bacterium]|nr:hypothetical protein [Planctomycetales bacterium]
IVLLYAVQRLLPRSDFRWYWLFLSAQYIVVALLSLAVMLSLWSERSWRWVFLGIAFAPLLKFFIQTLGIGGLGVINTSAPASQWLLYSLSELSPQIVVLALVLLAAVRDLRMRTPRHWTHWVGVASLPVSASLAAYSLISFYLLQEWN